MPLYDFHNTETDEYFEKKMPYEDKLKYLEDNPHIESVILSALALGDPTKLSATRKFDTGFREVLQKIHSSTPGSQLNKLSSQL